MKYLYYIVLLVFIIAYTNPIIAVDALARYQKRYDECVSRIIESQYMSVSHPYSMDTIDLESYFRNYTNLLPKIEFDGYPGDFLYDEYRITRLMYHYNSLHTNENVAQIIENAKKRIEEYCDKDDLASPEHIARMLLSLAKSRDMSDDEALRLCDRAEELCGDNLSFLSEITVLRATIYNKRDGISAADALIKDYIKKNGFTYSYLSSIYLSTLPLEDRMEYALQLMRICPKLFNSYEIRRYDKYCMFATIEQLYEYRDILKRFPARIIVADKMNSLILYELEKYYKVSSVHTELKIREIEELEYTNAIKQLRALIKETPKDNNGRVVLALGDLYAENNDITNAVAQYYEMTVSKTIGMTYLIEIEAMRRLYDNADVLTAEQKAGIINELSPHSKELERVPEYTQLMNALMKE